MSQADPSLECSLDVGSQMEIADFVAQAEATVDRAVGLALGFARSAAKDLDEATGRSAALTALEEAQSAWATYRDTHCDFVGATYGGGSGAGIAIRSCRVDLGRARVTELMNHAQ